MFYFAANTSPSIEQNHIRRNTVTSLPSNSIFSAYQAHPNRVSGVMVSMLASIDIGREFEQRL